MMIASDRFRVEPEHESQSAFFFADALCRDFFPDKKCGWAKYRYMGKIRKNLMATEEVLEC